MASRQQLKYKTPGQSKAWPAAEMQATTKSLDTIPQLAATNSTTLLHTMFHLLDRIEVWLEVVAEQKPGFEGGRHRGDPRALQVPLANAATHVDSRNMPLSPTRTIFSATASSVQGNRPRPSEYERSLVDLRRSFGLGASRSDIADGVPAKSVVGMTPRQRTTVLPRVSEDMLVAAEPPPEAVRVDVRPRSTTRAQSLPASRPRRRRPRPQGDESGPTGASATLSPKASLRPRTVPGPAMVDRKVRRDNGEIFGTKASSKTTSQAPLPAMTSRDWSTTADYTDLVVLVAHNWRQSLMLKLETAKERYRAHASSPLAASAAAIHHQPTAARRRRRSTKGPYPPSPAAPPPSNMGVASASKPRASRRRPQPAYV